MLQFVFGGLVNMNNMLNSTFIFWSQTGCFECIEMANAVNVGEEKHLYQA